MKRPQKISASVRPSRTTKKPTSVATPRTIVFTGGGTGGHVIPCLAVIDELRKLAPEATLHYVGGRDSIEERLATAAGLPFHAVAVGKLRRYLSLRNLIDAVKVPLGIIEAYLLLRQLRPDVVFAKGGYVSVPVVMAAGWLGIPVITHESDYTPGLATKINARYAKLICTSFAATKKFLPGKNVVVTGNPVRPTGNAPRGRAFLNFKNKKPILLVTGGSTGAKFLNDTLEAMLTEYLRAANIVWLTGGKAAAPRRAALRQFDYLDAEYPDVLAAADLVIARAGANTLFELAANAKPSLLVPLPATGSRGDQILNGRFFAREGAAVVYEQEHIRPMSFCRDTIRLLTDSERREKLAKNAKKLAPLGAAKKIAEIILQTAK